jgi:hypothetical protein
MLEFVNGSLAKEFGVRIGKKSLHDETFILHNPYLDLKDDMPRFDLNHTDDDWIPKLGYTSLESFTNYEDADGGDETSEGEDLGLDWD